MNPNVYKTKRKYNVCKWTGEDMIQCLKKGRKDDHTLMQLLTDQTKSSCLGTMILILTLEELCKWRWEGEIVDFLMLSDLAVDFHKLSSPLLQEFLSQHKVHLPISFKVLKKKNRRITLGDFTKCFF